MPHAVKVLIHEGFKQMKVFVSWSGERSRVVAAALSKWLPDVFQDLVTWMSAHNIDAGQRWGHELGEQLASTSFGILCLTPENLGSPWVLFEAGALSKVIGQAKVVPYLFQLSTTDVPFPLAQFQSVEASRAGTLDLVKSINASLERRSRPTDSRGYSRSGGRTSRRDSSPSQPTRRGRLPSTVQNALFWRKYSRRSGVCRG